MITGLLIAFSLLIEYIYNPISNFKDTYVLELTIDKYKEYFKGYFKEKYILYLLFPVIIFILFSIAISLINFIFHPFFAFLLNLIILIYCLKPGEFNRIIDQTKLISDNSEPEQFDKKRADYILSSESTKELSDTRCSVFYSSTRNIFNVLFWFLILGPAGSLAYTSFDYMINGKIKIDSASKKKLKQFVGYIEYVPIHLTLLSFALVDDFETCKRNWQKKSTGKDLYLSNIELINTIGFNLIDHESELDNDIFYTNAQMIIFRALLAWLSIIILLIFGGFFV